MPKRELYNVFFFGFLLLLLAGVGAILWPFAGALVSAFTIAVTCYPFYDKLGHWWPHRSATFRALTADLVLFVFLVVPVVALVWSLVNESEMLAQVMKKWGTTLAQWRQGQFAGSAPWLGHLRAWMSRTFGMSASQFQENVMGRLTQGFGMLASQGAALAQHALFFVFDVLVMQFTLFFFLRDGRALTERFAALCPLREQDTRQITMKMHDAVVAVVRGWFLTSLVQGLCAVAGYLVVGLPGAVLVGVLTALAGLLPVIGTFAVWIPVGIGLLIHGALWKGTFVLLWGAFVIVGLVDSVVRPYLVGQRADMSLFPLFFALLGGAAVFGAKGIIMGPLLFALAPVLLEIYRKRYLELGL